MQLPSLPLALSLSLAAGIAAASLVMPPAQEASARQRHIAVQMALAQKHAKQSCDGYVTLHMLLRSAGDAERFRKDGNCMEIVTHAQTLRLVTAMP